MKDIISFLSTTNVNIVNSWRAAHCPGCRAGERGLNWIFFTNLYFHSWWDFLLDVFHLFVYFHLVREVGPVLVTWLWRGCPRAAPQNLGRVAWLLYFNITKETQSWLTVCVATLGLDVGKKLEESSDQRLDEQRSRLTNEGREESLPAGELEKTFLATTWIFNIQLSRLLDNLPCLASGAATSTRSMRRARRREARRRRSSGPSWWRSSWTGTEDGGWSELSRWVAQEELGHHLRIRDGWRHQIGWIFGKVSNGPSLIFKKYHRRWR